MISRSVHARHTNALTIILSTSCTSLVGHVTLICLYVTVQGIQYRAYFPVKPHFSS